MMMTDREREVLELCAIGRSQREIAGLLCLTVATVSSHLQRIRAKLEARNTTHAVVIALRRGWLTDMDLRCKEHGEDSG